MKESKASVVSVEDLLEKVAPSVRRSYQVAEDALEGAALIRSMRKKAGLSKSEFARKLGVQPARVSAMEKGAGQSGPTYALLKRVARACGLEFNLEQSIRPAAIESVERHKPTRHQDIDVLAVKVIGAIGGTTSKKIAWFNEKKGYGFVQPKESSQGVFIGVIGVEGSVTDTKEFRRGALTEIEHLVGSKGSGLKSESK